MIPRVSMVSILVVAVDVCKLQLTTWVLHYDLYINVY